MSHSPPAEDQDELDAVQIKDNGEPLVDFLELCDSDRLILAPKHPVFEFPRVHLLRESVAEMICQAAHALPKNLRLQIVEGYRPIAVQRAMYAHALETGAQTMARRERANARARSRALQRAARCSHAAAAFDGGAPSIWKSSTKMGHDWISPRPSTFSIARKPPSRLRGISESARRNRELLRSVLEPTGLTNYADEWWHWSYGDNGWALRVGAPGAIYDKIELPKGAHWVGDMSKMPREAEGSNERN